MAFYLPLEDLPNNPNRYLKIARTLFKEAALNIRSSIITTLHRSPIPKADLKRLISF